MKESPIVIFIIGFFMLFGCSPNTAEQELLKTTPGSIAVPTQITAQLANMPEGEMLGYASVDGGERQRMTISADGATASLRIDNLSIGQHDVTIVFEFVRVNEIQAIELAKKTISVNLNEGSNKPPFTNLDYTPLPDDDGDDISNLDELVRNSDPTEKNRAPAFNNPAEIQIAENTTQVLTISATDTDGDELTFSIVGGDDQSLFGVNDTGVLLFNTAPDFENPQDSDANNTYIVTVEASDGYLDAQKTFTVTVTDIGAFVVGGMVTGLTVNGMILQNNNGDNLVISANGAFEFPTRLLDGSEYSVTVLTQPINPNQICQVSNGSGTLKGADVTNVTATCTTLKYSIGGTVTDLAGSGLVLQNNSGDDLTVNSSGEFKFISTLMDGSSYNVTVQKQPTNPNQICQVSNGSGSLNGADVTNITIACTTLKYSIGGTVTGLAGSGLILQNNGGDDLAVNSGGVFKFVSVLVDGSNYDVTVLKQPINPNQTCQVSDGSGTLKGANVTNITIACTTLKYSVGGTVTDLAGSGLVLQNNGGDDLAVSGDGGFQFNTKLFDGSGYSVLVLKQPTNPAQTCSVSNGTGSLNGADVTGVMVKCREVWYPVNNGLFGGDVISLAVDPVSPTVVFAGTSGGGVFKSTDGGVNWRSVHNKRNIHIINELEIDPLTPTIIYAGTPNGVTKSTDGGENWSDSSTGITSWNINALSIDPLIPTTLYAGTSGGIFKSTDGGDNWSIVNIELTNQWINTICIDPFTPTILYAGTRNGVFRSADGGANWSTVNIGLTSLQINALSIDPLTPATLYAGTSSGIFKSSDGGAIWSAVNAGLPNGVIVNSLSVDPQTPTTLYAGTRIGIFKSSNGSANWSAANSGLTSHWINDLIIDPMNPTNLYAGAEGKGVFKSTDSGVKWSVINTGLSAFFIQDLSIDPITPVNLYAATEGGGVFKSGNGGANWNAINSGLTDRTVNALSIDSQNPTTIYAGTSGDGVYKSTNGGVSWSAKNAGITNQWVNALSIDPVTTANVYAGTFGDGVFKSTNGGTTWSAMNTGLTDKIVYTLNIDPLSPTTLYAGTKGGVFKSSNGGANWSAVNSGLADIRIQAFSIDPLIPSNLYAATRSGIFKSINGGTNWIDNSEIFKLDTFVIEINPVTPDILYAGTRGYGVYKSVNSGANWVAINTGLTKRMINAISIDPKNPTTLYVGTWYGGIYKSTTGGQ